MENTQGKMYPKVLNQQDFDTWIADYLSRDWYLFFINPNTKAPFAAEAFALPEETERRKRELDEEAKDPSLNKAARAKARQNDQKYGKGLLDATNDIGDRQYPAPGTLRWLYWKAIHAETYTNPKTKKTYPVCPQLACATGPSGLFVLDLDVKEDFKEHFSEAPSFKALEALEEANGELPDHLLIATTPRADIEQGRLTVSGIALAPAVMELHQPEAN